MWEFVIGFFVGIWWSRPPSVVKREVIYEEESKFYRIKSTRNDESYVIGGHSFSTKEEAEAYLDGYTCLTTANGTNIICCSQINHGSTIARW